MRYVETVHSPPPRHHVASLWRVSSGEISPGRKVLPVGIPRKDGAPWRLFGARGFAGPPPALFGEAHP